MRVHVSYREPNGWTSPPRCHASRADAAGVEVAVTRLAGPDAAARRTWHYGPCDCPPDDSAAEWARQVARRRLSVVQ